MRERSKMYVVVIDILEGDGNEWKNLKRLMMDIPETLIYGAVMGVRRGEQARMLLLNKPGKFIMVSKYGEEHIELNYTTSRKLRSPMFSEYIAKYAKYMDLTVTNIEKKMDKPKECL